MNGKDPGKLEGAGCWWEQGSQCEEGVATGLVMLGESGGPFMWSKTGEKRSKTGSSVVRTRVCKGELCLEMQKFKVGGSRVEGCYWVGVGVGT